MLHLSNEFFISEQDLMQIIKATTKSIFFLISRETRILDISREESYP